jgi:hypothetical protein
MDTEHSLLKAEDVLREVSQLNFPLGKYVIVGGAVLAVHGMKHTSDIDIVASPELLGHLRQNAEWKTANRPSGEPGVCKGCIEVYPDVNCPAYHPEFQDLLEHAELVEGIPFASLDDVKLFKKGYGREKDFRDIQLIENYFASKK